MSTRIEEYVDDGIGVSPAIRDRYIGLCNSITEENHGKILQYREERTLCMFNNISDALNCAIQLQQECTKSAEATIGIGLHSGYISMIGDDIAGDGV